MRILEAQRRIVALIKKKRTQSKLSYAVWAKRSGFSVATLHGIISGKTKYPSWVSLYAAAYSVGLRMAWRPTNPKVNL